MLRPFIFGVFFLAVFCIAIRWIAVNVYRFFREEEEGTKKDIQKVEDDLKEDKKELKK